MNLRKKKQKFNYQDSEYLSKHFEYDVLTQGKKRTEIKTQHKKDKRQSEEKDYSAIFTELMKSIRKNIGETIGNQGKTNFEEQQVIQQNKQSQFEMQVEQEQQQSQIERVEQQMIRNFQKNEGIIKNMTNTNQSKLYRFNNHSFLEIKGIISETSNSYLSKRDTSNKHKSLISSKKQSQSIHSKYNLDFKKQSQILQLNNHGIHSSQFDILTRKEIQQQAKQKISQQKDSKLFKRCSFHIAISYYIHFTKNTYYTNPLAIDPTFNARKYIRPN